MSFVGNTETTATNTVRVIGTSNADAVSASPSLVTVTVANVARNLSTSGVQNIRFDADGGNDTLIVLGTAANDMAIVGTAQGSTGGMPSFNVFSVENVRFNGGSGGNDTLKIVSGTYNVDAD